MAGISTSNTDHMIRSQLWSKQLKEYFEDQLIGMKYVKQITDFPDGELINIPSIGQMVASDYEEGQAVKYSSLDTGNFTFQWTDYKQVSTFITQKMKQDSFYANELVSSFVPRMTRALDKAMEVDILSVGPDQQTASDYNLINGGRHRWVGSGTNETIGLADFVDARYALQKANIPLTNLIAIVDPSVELAFNKLSNLINVSNNPQWEGIVRDSIGTGMQFRFNVYGFDVYVSQNLKTGIAETIGGRTATTGVANMFFSADSTALPIIGGVKQAPKVDSEFNKDYQRDEYVTTARWGFKLYRPENLVTVITDTDQVYS